MDNKKIADIFNAIADMMEIEDDKRIFEIRAYRRAALTIETLQEGVEDILAKKGVEGLMELNGIGKTMAQRIEEYTKTGKMQKYEEMRKKFPFDIGTLTRIQGIGPKRAYRLYKALGVKDIATLKAALGKHRIKTLEGFGEKSESDIAKGVAIFEQGGGRMLLGTALPQAESIVNQLKESGFAERVEIAGSTRRMKETVGDLDILVISDKPEKMADFIAKMRETEAVVVRGPTKITVRLRMGLNCDVRIIEKESFGAAMQYFIGNKDHNVKVRQIAIKRGYKLNEYGLLDKKGRSVAGEDEKEVYAKLGMDYMEPEMRENRGEVELAQRHKIFRLVQLGDIRGDLHMHTTYSDGMDTMEDMVKEAIRLGREYIGFTDHSVREYVANGMDDAKFRIYSKEIERLRKRYDGQIKILKSSETDILKDGSLDWSDKILDEMDYVLASVHTYLNMPKKEMTDRVVKCIESGKMNIMGHPTNRLINRRPPIDLDLDRVFEAAEKNGVAMEIDAFPDRLDLSDENIIRAKKYNVRFSIDTDSHRIGHQSFMRYGVSTAKRGWLRKEDVINTLSFKELTRILK